MEAIKDKPETPEKQKRFTLLSRLKVRVKNFYKRFDIEKAQFESLHPVLQKGILIANLCIENKNSKLYSHPQTKYIQIELPEVFITIVQLNGFYEVDFVYMNQPVPTSDKLIYENSGVLHIFNKFDKEVTERMNANIKRKDEVVQNHLDNIYKATEKLSLKDAA